MGRIQAYMRTYPDSVNLVNPPNMTMPNTLVALANNQYATPLLLVCGKKDDFLIDADGFMLESCRTALLNASRGD